MEAITLRWANRFKLAGTGMELVSVTILYIGPYAINTNEEQQTQVHGIMAIVFLLTLLRCLVDIQHETQDLNLYSIALK